MIDRDNPAVAVLTEVDPKLIQELETDPSAAAGVLRASAITLANELFAQSRSMTVAQRMQLMDSFAKMGGIAGKSVDINADGMSGFSINIVLPGHVQRNLTVEAIKDEKVIDAVDVTPVTDLDVDQALEEKPKRGRKKIARPETIDTESLLDE